MVGIEFISKSLDDAIIKCSDGASLSRPLRKSLKGFADEYGKLTDHEELSIFDSDGNLITHSVGKGHSVDVDDDKLRDDGYTNLHITHNHPTLFQDNVPTYLSENDMESFAFEEMYKSISAVSPNGTSMTLIKNDNYQTEFDEDKVWNSMLDLHDSCQSYYDLYEDRVIEYMTDKAIEYQDNHPGQFIKASTFREEATRNVLEQMGTMEEYLKKKGVYDSLESVNVKLRINI